MSTESMRTHRLHDGATGELIEILTRDVTWTEVLGRREMWLRLTDNWYWGDRLAQLSDDERTELDAFRQSWRDITDFDTANDAGDNIPVCPLWAHESENKATEVI